MKKEKAKLLNNINKYLVFNAINTDSSIALDEIINRVHLSKPTVLMQIGSLKEDCLITESGKGVSSGGRRPHLYKMNSYGRFFIGINFQIPLVQIAAFDLLGGTIARDQWYFTAETKIPDVLERLSESVASLIDQAKAVSAGPLEGIGIAISGFIDKANAVSLTTPRIVGWENVPIGSFLHERFGAQVTLMNDTDALFLSELARRRDEKLENAMLVVSNYGVGTSIIVERQLITGRLGNAGSISHYNVAKDGLLCSCGKRECLETYVSWPAIERRYRALSGVETEDLDSFTAACADENLTALSIANDVADTLGRVIANIVIILEINQIILGGVLSSFGDSFLSSIRRTLSDNLPEILRQGLSIDFAREKDPFATAKGAVLSMIADFFKPPELEFGNINLPRGKSIR